MLGFDSVWTSRAKLRKWQLVWADAAGDENLAGRLHVEFGVRFRTLGHLIKLISSLFFLMNFKSLDQKYMCLAFNKSMFWKVIIWFHNCVKMLQLKMVHLWAEGSDQFTFSTGVASMRKSKQILRVVTEFFNFSWNLSIDVPPYYAIKSYRR